MNRTLRGAWARRGPCCPCGADRRRRGGRGHGARLRRGRWHVAVVAVPLLALGRSRSPPPARAGGGPPRGDRAWPGCAASTASSSAVTAGANRSWCSCSAACSGWRSAPWSAQSRPRCLAGAEAALGLLTLLAAVAHRRGWSAWSPSSSAWPARSASRWPTRSACAGDPGRSTAAVFGSVLIVVAAVVAVYRSVGGRRRGPGLGRARRPGAGRAGPRPGHGLGAPARRPGGGPRTAGRRCAFLATRRLARIADAVTPIRLLVAAAVVAATSRHRRLRSTRLDRRDARLRAGAPVPGSRSTSTLEGRWP